MTCPLHPCPCGALVPIIEASPPFLSAHGVDGSSCPASHGYLPLPLAIAEEAARWAAYRAALAATRGNVVAAAQLLGVSRATATRAVKRLGLLPLTQGLGWEKGSGAAAQVVAMPSDENPACEVY